ncbi:hypothetical protein PL11_001775 [Lentilactobacillus curieae]|uniref:S-layer protein n=1 Tax=Lentilactobacillus curieae TaxID=1138822 RepID=A0A1S6QGJ6_9LACO|nr:hypothetical protein [Lentilactobacillus curieae]AQW20733.1 hypothetical protein PL11_001775 [Lentilactobacillus curieae]
MDIKKTLLISAAALGMYAGVAAVNADNTNAKSYARVTSNVAMTSEADSRNVTFTGSNALYNKAGTLRGARKIATTTTLRGMANSDSSKKNFRAYRVATTNRGSVYYKVVAFDKSYRGWIYGGKTVGSLAGGISQYNTFKGGTMTDDQKNGTFKFANPGTANDDKTVTYKQPSWTQYKIGRQITDSTPYKDATFKIDQVGTRTRENDQWVHILATDSKNNQANGWILYSGLTKAEVTPPTDRIPADTVRINLVTAADAHTVKTVDYKVPGANKGTLLGTNDILPDSHTTGIQRLISSALVGTGYQLVDGGTLTSAEKTTLARTATGSSVNLQVQAISNNIAFNSIQLNTQAGNEVGVEHTAVAGAKDEVSAANAYIVSGNGTIMGNVNDIKNGMLGKIMGDPGQVISKDTVKNALTAAGLTDFYVVYNNAGNLQAPKGYINSNKKLTQYPLVGDFQIWHYTLNDETNKDITGSFKAGVNDLQVFYKTTKVKVPLNGALARTFTPDQWPTLFKSK